MGSHVSSEQQRTFRTSRLILSVRELVVLVVCIFGLLTAWLVYGGAGTEPAAHGTNVAAGSPQNSTLQVPRSRPTGDAGKGGSSPAPLKTPATPLAAGGAAATNPGVASLPVAGPAASAPQRIVYPKAGMDVVVHPLQPDSGDASGHEIEPPETKDGYWLVPFGTPGTGSTNTTYVIGHSWVGEDAPFNHLSSAAAPGDEFTVATATGVLTYTVESVTTYTKSALKDSPIWSVVPNRVVLISCYAEDPWGTNVTIVASPAPAH
jgi:Sortase domain